MELANKPSRLLCLDLETSGTSVFEDRIVTAFVGVLDTDTHEWLDSLNLLVNPGVPIPEGAAAIHGITTRVAKNFGITPLDALEQIDSFLHAYNDFPVVVMNANFDISLLYAEYERHEWVPLLLPEQLSIVDPLVVDRHHDRYRKGSRKLVDLAKHYGVPVDGVDLHDAAGDCWLAGHVAAIQIARYGMPTNEEQAQWHEEWRANFEEYLRRTNPDATVEGGWPIRIKEDQ